jgi:hypothetical protein
MNDLKLIKDKYGEKMMHFCRSTFSTILETPGLLYSLLKEHFEFNKFLYEDIEREEAEDMFKNYIYSMLNEEEAKVVRFIFNRYLEGAGYTTIARECEEKGFITGAGNTKWHSSTVSGILQNEKYYGELLLQKTLTVDYLTHKRVDNKGQKDLKIMAGLAERDADMRIIRNDPYLTRTRYNVVKGQNEYIHKGQRVNFVLLEPLRVKIFNTEEDI